MESFGNTVALVGAQWGDEGKGKITDYLSEKADVVVRFQGGNNAGHTIYLNEKKIVLHQIPSGILHPHCVCIVGHGVVFSPDDFLEELAEVKANVPHFAQEKLMISNYASVITKYHKLLDKAREGKSSGKIGTTCKGIGPCYEDKISRRGLKVIDLLDKETLIKKLKLSMEEKGLLFKELYSQEVPTIEEEADRLFNLGQEIKPYLADTFTYISELPETKKVLFEGAQGILLDIEYGSYPYVTSSNTTVSGVYSGVGFGEKRQLNNSIGVAKAYLTRVGEGPMPTEIREKIGDIIQEKGKEFGATTGRRRRCGWLDLPLLKYAIKVSRLNSIALTKIDILSNLSELKLCVGYKIGNQTYKQAFPGIDLAQVEPVFKSFDPFQDEEINDYSKVSGELKTYLDFIEDYLEVPLSILSFGPNREQVLLK